MENHLRLGKNELSWLSILSQTTNDKKLINFIINLDDKYKGADSYLDPSELPGHCLTHVLVDNQDVHPTFMKGAFVDSFIKMPFFKIGLKMAGSDGEKWNPATESLKAFVARHANEEVIYFEDEFFAETVSFFQVDFGQFS